MQAAQRNKIENPWGDVQYNAKLNNQQINQAIVKIICREWKTSA